MPGTPGVIRGELLVCFQFFAHEAAGAPRARHSLRPFECQGRIVLHELARNSCGEIAKPWPGHDGLFEKLTRLLKLLPASRSRKVPLTRIALDDATASPGHPTSPACGRLSHVTPALSSPSPLWGGKAEAKRRPGWGFQKQLSQSRDFQQKEHRPLLRNSHPPRTRFARGGGIREQAFKRDRRTASG